MAVYKYDFEASRGTFEAADDKEALREAEHLALLKGNLSIEKIEEEEGEE